MYMDETPEELELRIERTSDHRERAEAMAALAWKVKYARPRRAIELGEEARLLAEREGLADVIPRCLLPQAMGQLHLGAGDDAERSAMQALDLYRAGSDVKGERAACNVLGSVYLQQSKLSRALDCYLSAREAHLSICGDEDPGILSNIGAVQLALGDCESAIDSFLKAREVTGGDAPSDLRAATNSNLGDAYAAMGLHDQALECYRDCLRVCRRDNMKQALAITLSHMADSCVELGRQGQARICSLEAMDIYRELGNPLGRAVCLENLGGSAHAAGDHISAVDFFEEALKIYTESGSSRGRASASLGLAESLEGLGKTARALESLRSALELAPEIPGERLRARIHKSLAGFLERRGEAGEALKHLREYQSISERMLGESAAAKLSSLRLLHRRETARRDEELMRLREENLPEGGQRPSAPEPPPRLIRPGGSRGTILVVEDNDQVLELVSDVLRRAGYRVLACGMAAEAAAVLEDDGTAVDLVFTDIMLPDGSGIELARTVAEQHPDVKIVVGSGYTPSFDAGEFVEKMSIPFLAKPYRISDITEVMERQLRPGPHQGGAEAKG